MADVMRALLGGLAGVFALMLLSLPLWRYIQGRMDFKGAVGFWVAGSGFAVLAAAAFSGEPRVAQQLVILGVVLATAGSVVRNVFGE